MIYDKIEKAITLGKKSKFVDEDKWITPVYYDGQSLDFTLRNKYITIESIKENVYNKDFIIIKSKEYAELISQIITAIPQTIISPFMPDGSFRATLTPKTSIKGKYALDDLKNNSFKACISITIPTIYSDEIKNTIQINLKDIVVIEVISDELEIDMSKLEIAL